MAEMVGPELRLEPVRGLAGWASHDSGVGDDKVERLAGVDKRIGAEANAVERRQVKLDQLKSTAVRACAYARGRRFRLGQIARGADDVSAVSHERARRLHAETR